MKRHLHLSSGVTMIELLMVLAITATLAITILNRFKVEHRQTELVEIKGDVSVIMNALNRYMWRTGCSSDGTFPAAQLHPTLSQLGLPTSADSRAPLIMAYSANIIETTAKTLDNKPIYDLQVSAVLPAHLTLQRRQWLLKALDAQSLNDQTLVWTSLPGNSVSNSGEPLWILNASRDFFAQKQNWPKIQDKNRRSSAYCAR